MKKLVVTWIWMNAFFYHNTAFLAFIFGLDLSLVICVTSVVVGIFCDAYIEIKLNINKFLRLFFHDNSTYGLN